MKRNGIIALIVCCALCFILLAGCNSSGGGQSPSGEAVNIKVNSFLTESAPLTDGTKAIVARINEYTGGSVNATGYYNGNLIGFFETWEAIGNGTIDIGYIAPVVMDSYSVLTPVFSIPTAGLPLEGPIVLADLYNELIAARPEFNEEFAKSNITIIWVESLCGTVVSTTNRPIRTPADLRGLTIEGLGKATTLYFENAGCATVSLDVGDYYTSLDRGVIDAFYGSVGGIFNNQLSELLPYITIFGTPEGAPSGAGMSTSVMMYGCNTDTWNKFSSEQQEQIIRACRDGSAVGLQLDIDSQWVALDYFKELGHDVHYVWGDEMQAWTELAKPVLDDWIASVNAAGFDGRGIWDSYQQILADYNAGR
ncbi:MAG: TRAP transporter substrate-binding protein DctP [Oscillospiraceae bacterium]|nr:TRAP transporter substrate-binding protein DctP [Oscillospiraceae bacterium]